MPPRFPRALAPRGAVAALLAAACALAVPGVLRAATITGVVRDEGGVGVANVDIDFIDQCSGDNVFIATDHTAADGSFSLVIAAGTYDVHFVPAAGSTLVSGDVQDYVVAGNASFGVETLHPGRLVSGTVLTPALGPAAGIDLKWTNVALDHRVFLSKTVTDAAGHYAIRVPSGTWTIDFRPPVGSPFADAERIGLVVGASDVSGLSDALKSGFTVTGNVRGKSNTKLKNVDISLYDECTGHTVPTSHDNTDVNGNFSVVVPPGLYTFTADPPQCLGDEAYRQANLSVTGATTVQQVTLLGAVTVSGTVLATNGQPLANAKLKFYDVTQLGAPRQGTTRDHTAADGSFSIQVPPGTFDINVEPPPGVPGLVYHVNSLSVVGNVNVGTLQLSPGLALSGHVQGPGAAPQNHVNINVVDHVTRVQQRTANDDTDANGNFTVYVSPGLYDIHYDPPACSGMAPMKQDSVILAAALALPVMNVVPGVHVSGVVTDPLSAPVGSVDLDVFPPGSADKLYTPRAKSLADGSYDAFVPPGTYDIHYVPSSLTRFRPQQRLSVAAPTSQILPVTVLQNGWLVSGTVRDAATLAVLPGVTLEFYPNGQPPMAWTPHHVTGTLGTYDVSVDAATYDIRYVPPVGSTYAESWLHNVGVGADLPLADMLLAAASTGVGAPPRARLALGRPAPNPARGGLTFDVSGSGEDAEVSAWDIAGRRVATLWRGRAAGITTLHWDGSRAAGGRLPAGLYLLRLEDRHGTQQVERVVLLE